MKRNTFSIPHIVAIIGLSVILGSFSTTLVYAETVAKKEVTTTAAVTATKSTPEDKVVTEQNVDTSPIKEKAVGIWQTIKAWGISVYEKTDAWRVQQLGIWKDIKTEKELQITSLEQTTEENRNERVDNTLNGDQGTLFVGSSQDFTGTGNAFLLKLYVVALNIFVFIFTMPILFYGIITVVILSIINKIIQRIRNPHSF